MIFHAFFILSVLLSAAVEGEGATAAYHPTDIFLFNCGDTSDAVDINGRNWTAEIRQTLPPNSANASFTADASYEVSVPQVPYKNARIFQSSFAYNFPVSLGWKFLRLYFYPTRYGSEFDAVSSFFSVTVNGFTLLKNSSDILTAKASKSEYFIKEFIVPVLDRDTTLNLTFTPSPSSLAFVNGIEIVSMPDRFYSKGGFDNVITTVGSPIDYHINNSTAFETVHRRNVGGQMIDDVGDSDLFRRWLPDDDFMRGENSGIKQLVRGVINYTEKTPEYVAPEEVYITSRRMDPYNPKLNLKFNLTWLFTVDAGFSYLIRLHFCEILPEVTRSGQRIFSIFIQNQTAKKEMDVFYLAGGSRIPMYLDFYIHVGTDGANQRPDLRLDLHPLPEVTRKFYALKRNGVEILKLNDSDGANLKPDLRIDVHPSPEVTPKFYDVILNGVEILKLSDPNGNLAVAGLKLIGSDNNPNPETHGGKLRVVMITLIVIGSSIGLLTFILLLVLLMRHIKRKKNRKDNNVIISKVLLTHYTYAQVKKFTKSFSHTIGKGGFGTVYGGNLCNGRKIAVKVLNDSNGNGEDFINEVATMSQTSHVNIVSLLGFCYEGSKRAIVYEFLENGSLDQFISRKKTLALDVTTLYGIALGVARGLEYLHYGCKTRIVHFDIKPQNILLDVNLCPKVSDFGLAKLCEKRESIVSLIDTRGTIGYIAPEVFSGMYGRISHKSDVYSYGMLVLEMIGARNKEIVETTDSDASSAYFPDWIYKDLENGEHTWRLGDEITREEKEIARKMIIVALWCIQPSPLDRPPMNRVVEMMEGSLDALEVPSKPTMHISTGIIAESSSLSNDGEVG